MYHLILVHYLDPVCPNFCEKEKRLSATSTQHDRVLPK